MASMNQTPSGERIHIGFFGRRNAGKSSIVNAVTNQALSVVSDVAGTTTDPVQKAMEILPLGPVVIIDTPGFDDEGSLGELRVQKTRQILGRTDIAVLVVDANDGISGCDLELIAMFADSGIPFILAVNKIDNVHESDDAQASASQLAAAIGVIKGEAANTEKGGAADTEKGEAANTEKGGAGNVEKSEAAESDPVAVVMVSAKTGEGIEELKEKIASLAPKSDEGRLIADKIKPGDLIVLVVPIDEAAPKGRLILPQQQVIRDILDASASALVVKDTELQALLERLGDKKPDLVVTDSQVFGKVDKIVPSDVPLTSFSILMARYKGLLDEAVKGVSALRDLKDGDKILIAEGCTHHRQCGDIGSVKIPKWISEYTGKELVYETASGTGFPEDLSGYALVVHCGGCMLNEKEVKRRIREAAGQSIPITNYGTLIASVHGILERSLGIFPEYEALL